MSDAKTYIVTSPNTVLGHAPGDQFDAEISDAQESRLLNSGALKLVAGEGAGDPLISLKRTELDQLARSKGVTDPEALPNKEAVIKAINEAGAADDESNSNKEE